MNNRISRFYDAIEDGANQSQRTLIEFFVYHLTVELGNDSVTPKQVSDCFSACDLAMPRNVAARLNEGANSRPARLIKQDGYYKLQRHVREEIAKKLGAEIRTVKKTSAILRELESKLPEGFRKEFLGETIDCFEVSANRATIIMSWILTMDHLFEYILQHKLREFNASLAKDRGAKRVTVKQRDDFSNLKESKIIEICRAANIVSKDVRNILDTCLSVRNSCAHPSVIKVPETKVLAVVEDLVENIVLKY